MRKFFLKFHRWLALPLGVFIMILCFSGLILLIGGEIAAAFDLDPKQVPFLVAVKQLHRWLFMVPDPPRGGISLGRIITSVSAMCMTLILLSGVVLWWPKNKKMLKNRLTINTNKGFRRFVHDAHASLGIYVVVFLLLISLTGPVFSYGWYRAGMSKLFGQEMPPKEIKATTTNDNAFGQTKDDSQKKEATSPDGKKDEQGKKPKGSKLFKKIHTGQWGGWFSKILHGLAVLIGGFLPISGYYIWWKKRNTKKA